MKRILIIIGAVLLLLAAGCMVHYSAEERLVIMTEDTVVFETKAEKGTQLAARFIHSVHRTPVIDSYVIDEGDKRIVQVSTAYQAYGVGMPYLPQDGAFVQKGDFFVLTDLDLAFEAIDFRVGEEAKLTILMDGEEYPIYRLAPQGALVRMSIEPRYRIWLKKLM